VTRPLSIAELNDLLRTSFLGGQVVMTPGIAAQDAQVREEIITAVRTYDAFGPDNDPYGERDFGVIEHPVAGRVFWKIDYYDPSLEMGSEDPADPNVTRRVLTILLGEEW